MSKKQSAKGTEETMTNDELTPFEMASETMLGDFMEFLVDELKAAPDVWQKLSESQQQDIIMRAEWRVRSAISQAVSTIASADRPTLGAEVEQVVFKDGVKAVLKMSAFDPSRHELADATGKRVLVVVSDPDQHMGGSEEVKADPDQQSLSVGEDESEAA